jgi:hypothetical protein
MPRNLYTPGTSPVPPAPDPLLRFIQQAQLALVYSRRREGRLPLHDSFRLTLAARGRCPASALLQPTVHARGTSNQQIAGANRGIPEGSKPERYGSC